ncbi:alpha-L-rhamnosidase N-terminal domain-containing protein [Niabella insulamsoli]|uniref:alpha-L-rhamnosidase-related protein n=1 Tax=Niabella insulamsoli TaxID=3144874 RepID=UPI0031FC2A62
MKFYIIILHSLLFIAQASGQSASVQTVKPWKAQWISTAHISGDGKDYGVYYFRKAVQLDQQPASFVVYVSADNGYKLFVNGQMVSVGPAKGSFYNWNYETLDLAPFMKKGHNSVAAMVWNEANNRPEWQLSLRTAFIVQGASEQASILNTDASWKSIRDRSFLPLWGGFVAIHGQFVDMRKNAGDWWRTDFDDRGWPAAAALFGGQPKGLSDGFGYMLVPSPLPAREMTFQPITSIRDYTGFENTHTEPKGFPMTIPAYQTVSLLLDQTFETNAFPTLKFSGGKNAGISMSYAESLYDEVEGRGSGKSNRDVIKGKIFRGLKDSLISNGEKLQSFTPFHYRTFRYLRLIVQTQEDPLTIDSLYGTFTGYPFRQAATIQTDNAEIQKILDIGWRTARLNAYDTYMDCPYYEQLQYIGDTRIQAMVSYYYSGDDRLARYALDLMDASRLPEGVTLSRYPTRTTQVISTFSLWYIGMLFDYWMYRNDAEFLKDKLTGMRAILDFFSRYQQADGSLKNLPYWTFVDWSPGKGWSMGAPPKGADGGSAVFDLQLLSAFQWAAQMEAAMGSDAHASAYRAKAAQLKKTIHKKYWDSKRELYADTGERINFSQHANALAVLTGLVDQQTMPAFCRRLLADKTLTQCTIYFKYYLHQALVKGGLGNDYINWLDVWRDNIKMGLTTWAEEPDLFKTRSDCHAWGSSPNIEFFRTVLGFDTDAPGFSKIKVQPHLGQMTKVSGSMPHPHGTITASYKLKGSQWQINISLPPTTSGTLVWKNKAYPLVSGSNSFSL